MNDLLFDIRYALRGLRRNPGFAAVAVMTLALGIGANTAIFSVLDGVLLRRPPFRDTDRLAMVWETDRNTGTTREPASVPDYRDFQDRTGSFSALAAFNGAEVIFTPTGDEPTRLAALAVSHEFLPLVGLQPMLGRAFSPDDDQPGAPNVALIGEAFWTRRFARDPRIVGRTVVLNDLPATVIGVMPDGADFGTLQILDAAAYQRAFADRGEQVSVDVWVPLQADPEASPRYTHPIFVMGRLAPGVTVAPARQEMTQIAAELEATYPGANAARGAFVEPLTDVVFGRVRPALLVLVVAVGLVLLVAAANVANLLLARGTTRMREVAVRAAIGGNLRRLARQFLVEGVILAALGGAAGVALAIWGTEALLALAPADIPRLGDVAVNGRVLGATLIIATAVGVVFGLVPTFQTTRVDLHSALRGEARGRTASGRRGRARGALVVTQLALAVVLVIGAGLLIRSFWRLQAIDTGFRAEGVLKAEFVLPRSRYPVDFSRWPDFEEIHRFDANLLRRLSETPGIEAAALAGNHPLDAGFTNSFVVVGREAEARDWPEISIRRVTPGYFETVGLRLVAGRLLGDQDGTFDAPALVINETAARQFFPDGDPMGQQIGFWGAARNIVGVVADERIHGLTESPPTAVYLPLAQAPTTNGALTLLARAGGSPLPLVAGVRRAIHESDPGLAVYGIEPLTRTMARSLGQQRFTMLLLGIFATVAVALAVLGVHGVLSYIVAQRSSEMGIRMALGASRTSVVGLVLWQGTRLAVLGLAIGFAGALAATRLMRSLLFGVTATDPTTYGLVAVAVFGVAVFASWLPARRATRVDPVEALRHE